MKNNSKIDIHSKEVIVKSSGATVVKVVGMMVGLFLSMILARTIGAEGLGIINLSNRIVNILIVLGLFGMRQVIIKEISIAHNNGNFPRIGDIMHTVYWINGIFITIISFIIIFIAPWIAETVFEETRLTFPLILVSIVMLPQILSLLTSSAIVGFKKIWQSNLIEQTLSAIITATLLGFLIIYKTEITINLAAICYAIARTLVTITALLYWKTLYKNKEKNKLIIKSLLKASFPMFLNNISTVIINNISFIMLGLLSTTSQIGIYSVASRIAILTSFFLQVTNTTVAPKVAALFDRKKNNELEIMIQRITKGLTGIGLLVLIIFVILGHKLLSLWGKEFIEAYWILIILSFGQFVNISTGAVGVILNMTGYEKLQSKISMIFMILSILFNFLFIKYYGVIGAAISTTIIMIIINVLRVYYVRKVVNINPILFIKNIK